MPDRSVLIVRNRTDPPGCRLQRSTTPSTLSNMMSSYEQLVSKQRGKSLRRVKRLQTLAGKAVTTVYVGTGGRVGGRARRMPLLLLTTTGRRSGVSRTVPLIYVKADSAYVVVASAAGAERNPGWFHNLVADPIALVQVGSSRWRVHARVTDPDERALLYDEFKGLNRAFVRFEQQTEREIPVVVLEPVVCESLCDGGERPDRCCELMATRRGRLDLITLTIHGRPRARSRAQPRFG